MKLRPSTTALIILSLCVACPAGMRLPGKHCGVVIFDRWGGCILYSGIYVMYISEKVKEALRQYNGQAIQIDAKEVFQPSNPGDALIKQFQFLGPAPQGRETWYTTEGIRLASSVRIRGDGKPLAIITIENTNTVPVKLFRQHLAPTLLTRRDETTGTGSTFLFSPSDGPSIAIITRQSFEIGSTDEPRWQGNCWTIGRENALPHDFMLGPSEKKVIELHFDLPDGQYDFLAGYGGGTHESKCIASNLSAFDVENGKGKVANIRTR